MEMLINVKKKYSILSVPFFSSVCRKKVGGDVNCNCAEVYIVSCWPFTRVGLSNDVTAR